MSNKGKDLGGINSLERLHARCEFNAITDCLEWTGAKVKGTARVWMFNPEAGEHRSVCGARALAILTKRHVPEGMVPYHSCCNGLCMEPSHLIVGTRQEMNAALKAAGHFAYTPDRHAKQLATRRKRSKVAHLIAEIRSSEETGRAIAKRLDICESHVSKIRRRDIWKDGAKGSSVFSLGGV